MTICFKGAGQAGRSGAVWAVALMLALGAGAAQAQPVTKLTQGLGKATIGDLWCSALFYEESFWHDDPDISYYYDDLSLELEDLTLDALEDAGLGERERNELWQVYFDAAMELAEGQEDSFLSQLDACEAMHGDLVPAP